MNEYHYQRIPGPFESSAVRYALKQKSNQYAGPRQSRSIDDWFSSWWTGKKEVSTPKDTLNLQQTVHDSVVEAVKHISTLNQQEQASILFQAVNQTPEQILDETSLSVQLEQGVVPLEVVNNKTLVNLINGFALDLHRIESGELTQLSIVFKDNKGLIKLWHIDLNYLFSDRSAEILTFLLMQRFHLEQGTFFFKVTSPIQASALNKLVSSGRLLEEQLDLPTVFDSLPCLTNNQLEPTSLNLMPYEGGLTSTQRDNLQKDVLSPDSSFLKDAPKRILGFLATYIHASKTLSNPELRSRLLYNNHPESGEHLLFPNDPLMHSAPLFDKTDGYCTNLDYLDIGEQPLDLDFYLQGIQLIIGQISALTHTPGCLPKHVNAIQKLAKLLETKMDQFKLNPCRQTLITIKLELKQAISDSETIFANEPSIWQNNVMPFMNRLIELLNQCLKLFFVPKAYHVTFFKNKTTPIQDAWLESNIKSSLLDEEHGLISKIDSILPENNLYPS